ncbi:hypothetical protein K402DRAFT_3311 [Aulographum hederae CBS 113979]|uniref:BTB domain-containing protein n=1 Tax=Aulographum hederae CBS 113979 TaxID=1176131 RepID=A0A6G1HGE8_9PEZI|nr:hypothetical protein K402DRAFT_3311 [Aulographum hederae CBS 113979]
MAKISISPFFTWSVLPEPNTSTGIVKTALNWVYTERLSFPPPINEWVWSYPFLDSVDAAISAIQLYIFADKHIMTGLKEVIFDKIWESQVRGIEEHHLLDLSVLAYGYESLPKTDPLFLLFRDLFAENWKGSGENSATKFWPFGNATTMMLLDALAGRAR